MKPWRERRRDRTLATLTETDIQDILYYERAMAGHISMLPNCYIFGENESDLVSLTKADYVWEYEIKIARIDFRADKKKERDWRLRGEKSPKRLRDEESFPWLKDHPPALPNRFYYVAPEGIIPHDEVPAYAGLFEIAHLNERRFIVNTIKRAPLLHKESVPERIRIKILRGFVGRYWAFRMGHIGI